MTTYNKYLWITLASDIGKPEDQQMYHRFLCSPERMAIQGKSPWLAVKLKSEALAMKASGNAYPTPVMVAAIVPMLQAVSDSGANKCGLPRISANPKALVHTRFLRRFGMCSAFAMHAGPQHACLKNATDVHDLRNMCGQVPSCD